MSSLRQLKQLIRENRPTAAERMRQNQCIVDSLFATSSCLTEPDFRRLHPDDILLLYELYDENYFCGLLTRSLNPRQISFRLSTRMTRAGGKTTRWSRGLLQQSRYEIAISTTLLFQSFSDPERKITVTGLDCDDRLQALMRVMEHELIHLIEMLIWKDSSCSQFRFQEIASRFFGHTDHRHDLITPQEVAQSQFGVRPGIRVRFDFQGHRMEGIVNRVTRRATVLVAHAEGRPYSDGRRYLKFYIPLADLEVAE